VGAFVATVCLEKPAEAQNSPWCAYYNAGGDSGRNCGFATLQQCLSYAGSAGTVDPVGTRPRRIYLRQRAPEVLKDEFGAIAPAVSRYLPHPPAPHRA
jgi:hypothetical protein